MSTSMIFADGANGPELLPDDGKARASSCKLDYYDEGGANCIFSFHPITPTQPLPTHLQGKLLRLRKDLPHEQNAVQRLSSLQTHFAPLFPTADIVASELIALGPGLLAQLNAALETAPRPSHRVGNILPVNDTHGLLVTDMSGDRARGEVAAEVKAKWLAQSPTAPRGATRCRTCALRAQRAGLKAKSKTDAQGGCPLALVSERPADREEAAGTITEDAVLRRYLAHEAQGLLGVLRRGQLEFDARGPLAAEGDEAGWALCKAMTLRDCSIFLRRSKEGERVEARVADLDLKQPQKVGRWKEVERELIDGGWYTNDETEGWTKEEVCLLAK